MFEIQLINLKAKRLPVLGSLLALLKLRIFPGYIRSLIGYFRINLPKILSGQMIKGFVPALK
jgi:hypothetical protein